MSDVLGGSPCCADSPCGEGGSSFEWACRWKCVVCAGFRRCGVRRWWSVGLCDLAMVSGGGDTGVSGVDTVVS